MFSGIHVDYTEMWAASTNMMALLIRLTWVMSGGLKISMHGHVGLDKVFFNLLMSMIPTKTDLGALQSK